MNDPKAEFLRLLGASVTDGTFVKLTLGRYVGGDRDLRNLHVRPVRLRSGPHLSFVWRHATRDVTKNHAPADALARLATLTGGDFRTAHLFTVDRDAQLEFRPEGRGRLRLRPHAPAPVPSLEHDKPKQRPVSPTRRWLSLLGVTTADGAVRAGMADKFRQINRFVDLLAPLVREAHLPDDRAIEVADMGCGKGYLTFAAWQHFHDLGARPARVRGVERRPELVALCNRAARDCGCDGLEFQAGTVADVPMPRLDVLIALHACDTATDDAIARGIAFGAALIVVAPCCHRELSSRLQAPAVLAPVLRHGIFHEREADFVTDALRTLLLEWSGYEARAFEFVSTEHTPRNLMIAAIRRAGPFDRDAAAAHVRALAAHYGVRQQALADRLGFSLAP